MTGAIAPIVVSPCIVSPHCQPQFYSTTHILVRILNTCTLPQYQPKILSKYKELEDGKFNSKLSSARYIQIYVSPVVILSVAKSYIDIASEIWTHHHLDTWIWIQLNERSILSLYKPTVCRILAKNWHLALFWIGWPHRKPSKATLNKVAIRDGDRLIATLQNELVERRKNLEGLNSEKNHESDDNISLSSGYELSKE